MTADDYATLMDFLATRFARMDAALATLAVRQDALEARLARSEVLWEAVGDEIRRLAEGVRLLNERLDRFQAEMRKRFDQIDARFDRIEARRAEHDPHFEGL